MANVFRTPLVVDRGAIHPASRLPAIFQPGNLLVGVLGVAVGIIMPLRNADALAWAQLQHPSHGPGYINPDTSRGSSKALLTELTLPLGGNRLLEAVSTPDQVRTVVDTSRGSPRLLLVETLPVGAARFLQAPEPNRLLSETSWETARTLFLVPSPFPGVPHQSPPRFWFQPCDSSIGMAKVLTTELRLPFNQKNWTASPEYVHKLPDTSLGVAKVLYKDSTKPFYQSDWSSLTFRFQQPDAWSSIDPAINLLNTIVTRGRPHMTRTVMAPKFAGTTKNIAVDFISQLFTGETISTAVVTCSVYSGVDASPSSLVNGVASISGSIVTQSITGGNVGTIYQLLYTITTSIGETLQMSAFLAINQPL